MVSGFTEALQNLESCRKNWLQAELDLKRFKELLVKSDVAKAALEVKLKHARNQLDVEMKKRYKIEADYQYLVSSQSLPVLYLLSTRSVPGQYTFPMCPISYWSGLGQYPLSTWSI